MAEEPQLEAPLGGYKPEDLRSVLREQLGGDVPGGWEIRGALSPAALGLDEGEDLLPAAVESIGRSEALEAQVRAAVVVAIDEEAELRSGLLLGVEVADLPQLALHRGDGGLDLPATLGPVGPSGVVVDQLRFQEALEALR